MRGANRGVRFDLHTYIRLIRTYIDSNSKLGSYDLLHLRKLRLKKMGKLRDGQDKGKIEKFSTLPQIAFDLGATGYDVMMCIRDAGRPRWVPCQDF